jgi:choline dehydrogenase-like flavoprotein
VEGFSVFLIEAGGDGSKDIAERIPSLYVSSNLVLCPTDTAKETAVPLRLPLTPGSSSSSIFKTTLRPAATPNMRTDRPTDLPMLDLSHLPRLNRKQATPVTMMRQPEKANDSLESKLGILYPRGATLGGSSQVNAMNFAWAPDNEWDYIAELTGDESWGHEHMREHLVDLENCTYVPQGTPGHGYDGYLEVRQLLCFC